MTCQICNHNSPKTILFSTIITPLGQYICNNCKPLYLETHRLANQLRRAGWPIYKDTKP